jgi:sortase (surface protein transpeptidase)
VAIDVPLVTLDGAATSLFAHITEQHSQDEQQQQQQQQQHQLQQQEQQQQQQQQHASRPQVLVAGSVT